MSKFCHLKYVEESCYSECVLIYLKIYIILAQIIYQCQCQIPDLDRLNLCHFFLKSKVSTVSQKTNCNGYDQGDLPLQNTSTTLCTQP